MFSALHRRPPLEERALTPLESLVLPGAGSGSNLESSREPTQTGDQLERDPDFEEAINALDRASHRSLAFARNLMFSVLNGTAFSGPEALTELVGLSTETRERLQRNAFTRLQNLFPNAQDFQAYLNDQLIAARSGPAGCGEALRVISGLNPFGGGWTGMGYSRFSPQLRPLILGAQREAFSEQVAGDFVFLPSPASMATWTQQIGNAAMSQDPAERSAALELLQEISRSRTASDATLSTLRAPERHRYALVLRSSLLEQAQQGTGQNRIRAIEALSLVATPETDQVVVGLLADSHVPAPVRTACVHYFINHRGATGERDRGVQVANLAPALQELAAGPRGSARVAARQLLAFQALELLTDRFFPARAADYRGAEACLRASTDNATGLENAEVTDILQRAPIVLLRASTPERDPDGSFLSAFLRGMHAQLRDAPNDISRAFTLSSYVNTALPPSPAASPRCLFNDRVEEVLGEFRERLEGLALGEEERVDTIRTQAIGQIDAFLTHRRMYGKR